MTRNETGKIEIIVGTFFVVALILIAGMVITVKGGNLFGDTWKLAAQFDHIGELQEGAPVKLGGVTIGQVTRIRLAEKEVLVEMELNEKQTLTMGCKAKIAGAGLVGDTFVEIVRGKLPGTIPQAKTMATATKIKGEGSVDMAAVMRQLTDIGDRVAGLIDNINELAGDKDLQENIRQSVANVNSLTVKANRLVESLGRTSEHFEVASKNVVSTASKIERMTSTVETALNETVGKKENIDAINETIANVRKVGRSIAGQTTQIELAVANVTKVTENLKEVTAKAKDLVAGINKGILRSLFDPKAGDQLEETLKSFKEIADIAASFGLTDILADLRIADRIIKKWEKEARTRNLSASDMMTKWQLFVQEQREQFGHVRDEKFPNGPPWLKKKLLPRKDKGSE